MKVRVDCEGAKPRHAHWQPTGPYRLHNPGVLLMEVVLLLA